MLKAIGKFVIRRSRGVYQRRPPIGEDDKALNPRDDSEVTLQLAEPQLATRTRRTGRPAGLGQSEMV